ncbi:hypothetical protein [Pararoseomonas baculiformis]|nr:hypothetical protein [Pararoseomonas baculiformis]
MEIENLKLNEIGDAVAGFASILAFMWIVIAVYLQTHELRQQRHAILASNQEQAQQTAEFQAWKKAAEDQLSLLRGNQLIIFSDYVKRVEEEAVRGLLSQVSYEIVPELNKLQSCKVFLGLSEGDLNEWRHMLEGRRFIEAATAIGVHLFNHQPSDALRSEIRSDLMGVPKIRERIDLLSTLIVAYHVAGNNAGPSHHQVAYDIGVHLIESGLNWLFEFRDILPAATDQFTRQLQEFKKQSSLQGKVY